MPRRGDGLVLRGKTWWLDFSHQGQRHQVRLGRNVSRTVARELAAVERSKALRQDAGIGGRKRKDISFDKAAEEFLKWAEANHRPRSVQNYRWNLDQLKKSFAGKMLSQISPFNVEKHKQARIADDAKVAANREISCLRNLFYRCVDWGKFDGANPARQSKGNQAGRLTKEPLTRLRFLSHEEETSLISASTEPLRTVILIGIHAGLRIKSEALSLEWGDIDFRRGQITVQAVHAKNGESRTVPMNTVLKEALTRLRERSDGSGRIFVSRSGQPFRSIRTQFTTACRNAKLADVTPHTLRHTFASRLAIAGVGLRTIQELGGWKEIRMVLRYAHLSDQHKADAVERITGKIADNSTTVITTAKSQSA
jgi:integrase